MKEKIDGLSLHTAALECDNPGAEALSSSHIQALKIQFPNQLSWLVGELVFSFWKLRVHVFKSCM